MTDLYKFRGRAEAPSDLQPDCSVVCSKEMQENVNAGSYFLTKQMGRFQTSHLPEGSLGSPATHEFLDTQSTAPTCMLLDYRVINPDRTMGIC